MCEAETRLRDYSKLVKTILKKFPDAQKALLEAEQEILDEERKRVFG